MATATENQKSVQERIWAADLKLGDGLLEEHNDAAKDLDDFRYACPLCGKLNLTDDPDEDEDLCCEACDEAQHRTCSRCGERILDIEMSLDYPHLCENCAEDYRAEQIEELRDQIGDSLDGLEDDDAEQTIEQLKKILRYINRLSK